jgi:hypothetical protein
VLLWSCLVAACSAPTDGSRQTSSNEGPPQVAAITRTLRLPAGRVLSRSIVELPDPSRHEASFLVRSSSSVRLVLWLVRIDGGSRLDIFHGTSLDDCYRVGSDRRCLFRLPALEAQRGGAWQLLARDKSGRGGTARLEISFIEVTSVVAMA